MYTTEDFCRENVILQASKIERGEAEPPACMVRQSYLLLAKEMVIDLKLSIVKVSFEY